MSGLSGSGRKEGGVTTKAHSSLLGGKAGTTPLSRSWVMRWKAAELRQKLQALSTETPGLALVERLPRGKQLDWCLFMWILPNFFTVQCEKIGSISVPHCCAYFVHTMQVQLYIVGEANKIVWVRLRTPASVDRVFPNARKSGVHAVRRHWQRADAPMRACNAHRARAQVRHARRGAPSSTRQFVQLLAVGPASPRSLGGSKGSARRAALRVHGSLPPKWDDFRCTRASRRRLGCLRGVAASRRRSSRTAIQSLNTRR